MPWTTPTLRDVRSMVRDAIRAQLPGADATVPNSVLRVTSDVQGGLCHLTLQYVDWLALQLLPDTAETVWLDRHGQIWLKNADATIGRKQPTPATGIINLTGQEGTVIPQWTELEGSNGVTYETTAFVIIGNEATPVTAQSVDFGSVANLEQGAFMAFAQPPPGADAQATVVLMDGGTDTETDDELRFRVLKRIQEPPMGGDKTDYEIWGLAVPGVTRAWCAPNEMGIGTVTLRFLMDDLRATNTPPGWPLFFDIQNVATYLDTVRPVAVKDIFIEAPIPFPIELDIEELTPDTPDIRAQIEQSVQAMLAAKASPGQTIFAAWKSSAVMSAAGVDSFRMTNNLDDVMPAPGYMAVLGDIYYAS